MSYTDLKALFIDNIKSCCMRAICDRGCQKKLHWPMNSSAGCRMNQKQNAKKESMNYLLIELDQVKFERKKKLALGQDPHFEKHNE